MNGYLQRAVLLLAVLPLAGCGTFGSDNSDFMREQLTRAEQRWASTGSSDYTLVVTRRCDCGVEPRQVALEVVDDAIVGATFTDTGEPVETTAFGQYATVLTVFAIVHDAINRRVPLVLVEYNQEFGYVDNVTVNYDLSRIDDDFLYVVDDYIPPAP